MNLSRLLKFKLQAASWVKIGGKTTTTTITTSRSLSNSEQRVMGVTIESIKPGDGKTFPVKGQMVIVHYVGTLQSGEKFDSSWDRGTPFQFKLGNGDVIKGWDEGVAKMTLGQKAKLICTSDYAYGPEGYPPLIPPNATLVFEIELLKVKGKSTGKTLGKLGKKN